MRRSLFRTKNLLFFPTVLWMIFFFIVPLFIVAGVSFLERGTYGGIESTWNVKNYLRAFDSIYLGIFLNSVELALATAASCLLIGFPMAYVLATAGPRLQRVLVGAVVLPFWTNFIVRVYGVKLFLSEFGPLGQWATELGLSQGPFTVWFGMVSNYLPFMVLPLYVVLEKFDFTLLDAARDLGASRFDLMFRVLIPLLKRGLLTGFLFVFTPALGEFVIPDQLGGARGMLVGNLMTEQFLRTRDWPFGGALAVLLLGVIGVCMYFSTSLPEPEQK